MPSSMGSSGTSISSLFIIDEPDGEANTVELADLDSVKGNSVRMLETDRRGGDPCADRLRPQPLSELALHDGMEDGISVTSKPGRGTSTVS